MAELGHSSSERPSWKGKGSAPDERHKPAGVARWIFSFSCLALLVLLLQLLVPPCRLNSHVVTVTVGESDKLAVPPVLFAEEDATALKQIVDVSVRDLDVQEAGRIEGLAESLAALRIKKGDALIVFVSAQGISQDGTAYLLYEDYEVGPDSSLRYPVPVLFESIQACESKVKLLILDCGNIVSDTRLGLLLNEFPRLLEDVVSKWPDPKLWVLASHSLCEASNVSFPDRRSIFGRSVVEGLRGHADGEGTGKRDAYVTILELYRYVAMRCQAATGRRQTPLVMHAGQRIDELTERSMDIRIVELSSEAISQQDASRDAGNLTKGERQPATTEPNASAGTAATPQTTPEQSLPPETPVQSSLQDDPSAAGVAPQTEIIRSWYGTCE